MSLYFYLFTFAMMSLAAVAETGPDDRVVHLMQVFAVPTRYTHLPHWVTDWVDLDHAIDLLVAVRTHLDGSAVAGLRKF